MKDERYGILVNAANVIVYFEFDPEAPWDKTTGGKNKKQALVVQDFTDKGPKNGIASYYFNQPERSITVIDKSQEVTMLLIDIEYNPDTAGVEKFASSEISLSDQIGQEFQTVTGYKNLRAFANPDYDIDKGIVRIFNWSGATGEVLFTWIGQNGTRLGEYVWIGEDTLI